MEQDLRVLSCLFLSSLVFCDVIIYFFQFSLAALYKPGRIIPGSVTVFSSITYVWHCFIPNKFYSLHVSFLLTNLITVQWFGCLQCALTMVLETYRILLQSSIWYSLISTDVIRQHMFLVTKKLFLVRKEECKWQLLPYFFSECLISKCVRLCYPAGLVLMQELSVSSAPRGYQERGGVFGWRPKEIIFCRKRSMNHLCWWLPSRLIVRLKAFCMFSLHCCICLLL